MENGKDTSQVFASKQPRGAALKAQPVDTRTSAYESVAPSVYTFSQARSQWSTSLLVALLGSQTRSRRLTSRSKASSTFEALDHF